MKVSAGITATQPSDPGPRVARERGAPKGAPDVGLHAPPSKPKIRLTTFGVCEPRLPTRRRTLQRAGAAAPCSERGPRRPEDGRHAGLFVTSADRREPRRQAEKDHWTSSSKPGLQHPKTPVFPGLGATLTSQKQLAPAARHHHRGGGPIHARSIASRRPVPHPVGLRTDASAISSRPVALCPRQQSSTMVKVQNVASTSTSLART